MKTFCHLAAGLALVAGFPLRAAEVDPALVGLHTIIEQGAFEHALRVVNDRLAVFPGHPSLLAMRENLLTARAREMGAPGESPRRATAARVPVSAPSVLSREAAPGRDFVTGLAELAMVWIAPGKFVMSSAHGSDDDTVVTLTRGYWIGRTEVTQAQWQLVLENIPLHCLFKGSDRPVESVAWFNAMDFCRKLTEREHAAGRLPEGYEFRLPTEAQWEYACRAGTTGSFAGPFDEMAWHAANSDRQTQPVGQKRPNAWGLHDMHGNVLEWCLDGYQGYPGGEITDPDGRVSDPAGSAHRIVRGGAWNALAGMCRSDFRYWQKINYSGGAVGFRVVLAARAGTVEPPAN